MATDINSFSATTQPYWSNKSKPDNITAPKTTNTLVKTPNSDEVNLGTTTDTKKRNILLGVGALATAAIATATIILTKGKAKPKVTSMQSAEGVTNEVKGLTLQAFREAGNKLQKGKAISSNGEMFTGTINHITQNGKSLIMQYENGVLKSSKKMDGTKELFNKVYDYTENGLLKSVKDNGKTLLQRLESKVEGISGYAMPRRGQYVVLKNNNTGAVFISDNSKDKMFLKNKDGKFLRFEDLKYDKCNRINKYNVYQGEPILGQFEIREASSMVTENGHQKFSKIFKYDDFNSKDGYVSISENNSRMGTCGQKFDDINIPPKKVYLYEINDNCEPGSVHFNETENGSNKFNICGFGDGRAKANGTIDRNSGKIDLANDSEFTREKIKDIYNECEDKIQEMKNYSSNIQDFHSTVFDNKTLIQKSK